MRSSSRSMPATSGTADRPGLTRDTDKVVLENYDDQDYGYLRVLVTAKQLRIEFHPTSDGHRTKTPDDSVTVDLQTRKRTQFNANDLGRPEAARAVRKKLARR